MAVAPEEDVLGLEVAVHEAECVEVLDREQHLRGVEPGGGDGQARPRPAAEHRVQVPPGAVVHEEAGVASRVEARVERGYEGVVERGEDARLGEHVGDAGRVVVAEVDDLEREERGRGRGALEAAEEDAREVAVAELADEVEVREAEHAVGRGGARRGEVRPVRGRGGRVRARGQRRGGGEGRQRQRAPRAEGSGGCEGRGGGGGGGGEGQVQRAGAGGVRERGREVRGEGGVGGG